MYADFNSVPLPIISNRQEMTGRSNVFLLSQLSHSLPTRKLKLNEAACSKQIMFNFEKQKDLVNYLKLKPSKTKEAGKVTNLKSELGLVSTP